MRYKIVFLGTKYLLDPDFTATQLSLMVNCEVEFALCSTSDEAMEHFFSYDPVLLLVIEEDVEGMAAFVEQLRVDEVFQNLPIIVLVEKNDSDRRKVYFSFGIDNLLEYSCDQDEFLMGCHSSIRSKIRLDVVMERLRVVTEENITRAIQLDIIHRYLPETVYSKTADLAQRQAFEIPEEEQSLAVMFADLRAFTTMSETMVPRSVIALLNQVFTLAVEVIYRHGGDIDKFIGDAFLAVFSDPKKALAAGLEIQGAMKLLNGDRVKGGGSAVQFRIGLHFGTLIRGSVGGHRRYDHTLIGDVVNTAQRLESMAPPGGLLVSQVLFENIPGFPLALMDFEQVDLKGKAIPVMACSVCRNIEADPELYAQILKHLEN